jgi:hypothetical protein
VVRIPVLIADWETREYSNAMPVPAQGTIQAEYVDHIKFDAPTFVPATTVISTLYEENLLGRRSGIGISTPWGTPILTGLVKAPYTDTGSGGTVTYAATTVTDTSKTGGAAWVVNAWANRYVISVGTGSGVTFGKVASNTATVLTLTAAGWSNGTPSASAFYVITPVLQTATTTIVERDSWTQGVLRQDGNTEAA